MKTTIYNIKGQESGDINLPESVFGLPWNADLVDQVIVSMMSSARQPIAHAKNRGEVRGGGKKPWKQKGTGRARHGSRRSPIWVGGGVTHGPRNEKIYLRKINKKMKAKALATILSRKLRDNEIVFLDAIDMKEPKTKEAKSIISSVGKIKGFEKLPTKRKNAAVVGISEKNSSVKKSFSNFGNLLVDELRNVNPVDLVNYKYLIIENPAESIKILEARINN